MIAFDISEAGLKSLSCPACNVTWRGPEADLCWSCGGPSVDRWSPAEWLTQRRVTYGPIEDSPHP